MQETYPDQIIENFDTTQPSFFDEWRDLEVTDQHEGLTDHFRTVGRHWTSDISEDRPFRRHRHRHRKVQPKVVRKVPPKPERRRASREEKLSFAMGAATLVIMAVVCALGGRVTHDPLRRLAGADAPRQLADWWPLLVYGPWTVASLSILRAALHQRRAPHSWCVVLMFSMFAMAFCIDQAPRTITGATVASLPTIATVSCFHQLVRQITLTRPPRRGGAGRRGPL